MKNNKLYTVVEWLAEKTFNQIELLKHSCISEEQFLNNMLIFREQAKEIEKEQHAKTWDKSMDNLDMRGGNIVRAWEDFDEYYNETYGGNK
jgi:hypothetical protein